MAGIIILSMLGVILLALLIALLLPGYIRADYENGEAHIKIRYGWWSATIYPIPDKLEKLQGKPKRKRKKKQEKRKNQKAEIPNIDQIQYSIDILPDVLIRTLKRVRRKVRIYPLKIHLLVAGTDPADTAMLYGYISAALGAILPALHQVIKIKDQDIQLFTDFTQEKMDVILDIGIGMRILDVIVIAVSALGGILDWRKGYKQRGNNPNKNKTTDKASAAAEKAA